MNAPLPPDARAVAALPIGEIVPSPSNPRKHVDSTYLAELAESIKAHGLIQPITVRPLPLEHFLNYNKQRKDGDDSHPQYEIVVGECRWRAAKLAGLAEIPGFWRELDDKQVLEIQVIENLQRRDVHPIEEAEGYEQLMQRHGYKAEEIAAKIGKSKGYVYARLKLTALCQEAREVFFEGKLDASTALLVARIPGATLQKRAAKEISVGYDNQPLSYRNAVNHIRHHFTVHLDRATFALDDAELVPTAGSCQACPKRSGNSPELCADLDSEHVCTDTACFEDKRLTRRQQLIVAAEQKGVKVITGKNAEDFMPYGVHHLDSSAHISLNEKVRGDAQDRTYREILGDDAPVTTLVEERSGHLVELGDPTALAAALRKAGWQPDLLVSNEQAEKDAKRQQEAAEREARREAAETETVRRQALADTLIDRARHSYDAGEINPDYAIILLAIAQMRQDFEINGEPDEARFARCGITLPKEPIDDNNAIAQMTALAETMRKWSPGTALAYLLDAVTVDEVRVTSWDYNPERDQPYTLQDLAALLPAETVADPTQAAQAHGEGATEPAAPAKPKGKKAAAAKTKAKAAPAPALPANEPPAAAKPTALHATTAWPFPTRAAA